MEKTFALHGSHPEVQCQSVSTKTFIFLPYKIVFVLWNVDGVMFLGTEFRT